MDNYKNRVVFMGSPEISVPSLRALAQVYPIAGVVTQPDKPGGRGKKMISPAIKIAADELGLPCIQPKKMKDTGVFEQLQAWSPEVIIVMAFGKIIRPKVLELPPKGCVNIHASLLPRWRGASPIQSAILHGDSQTGVTIMKMDAGIDTGDMLATEALAIEGNDTSATLSDKISKLGAFLLLRTLPAYLAGELLPRPQSEEGACYASMINKQDGQMDFADSAINLERKIRAFNPWPSAWFMLGDAALKVYAAHIAPLSSGATPGTRAVIDHLPAVAAADGMVVLDSIQAPGKKAIDGKAFLAGCRNWMNE